MITDHLSTMVQRVDDLPWYMDPSRSGAALCAVSDKRIRAYLQSFLEDGYVVIPESVPATLCDTALSAFRRCEATNPALFRPHVDDQGHYPRIVNLHLVIPELRRLFSENHDSLKIQDILFQSETVLYTSLFYERGSAQDIHRDTPYFCTRPEYRYFGMWVALEDVDDNNGPLMVMPGGHLMPELDRESLASELFGAAEHAPAQSNELWELYQSRVYRAGLDLGLTVKTVPVPKGSTIIWHPQLPHGGSPIGDFSRTRFSLVMHTTPYNMPVYHQDAFFNPRKHYPTEANWPFTLVGDRLHAEHPTVSFNHAVSHSINEFIAP